ncbi:hypothetical protein B0H16DRAFT_1712819 [Mycena metata]|uniref:Uncharacterized protein n=1 Tax=Mycena metata TaxID=1033252 RepID=A0AAD7NVC1_9AGAR|nr:hypothetical protein B0H16DRAFT_1712819 [Mycena metata]
MSTPFRRPLSRGASKSDRGITHPVLRKYVISWTLRNEINETEINDTDSSDDTNCSDDTNTNQQSPKLTANATEALRMLCGRGLLRGPFVPHSTASLDRSCICAIPDQQDPYTLQHPSTRYFQDGAGNDRQYGVVQGSTMLSTADWGVLDGHFNEISLTQ